MFGVIIDNQISPRDSFPEYNVVTVGIRFHKIKEQEMVVVPMWLPSNTQM